MSSTIERTTRKEVTVTEKGEPTKIIVEEFRDRNGFYASETLETTTDRPLSLTAAMKAIDDSLKDARNILRPAI